MSLSRHRGNLALLVVVNGNSKILRWGMGLVGMAGNQLVVGQLGPGADGKESKYLLCLPEGLPRHTSTYSFRGR